MSLSISYMGTKRRLAGTVAELVEESRGGPFLDLFAGMCSVAGEVRRSRQVWTNDIQKFAHLVAKTFLCAGELAPNALSIAPQALLAYSANMDRLTERYGDLVQQEAAALNSADLSVLQMQLEASTGGALNYAPAQYNLFTERYAGAYFGVRQCMEIDSLRYAIDSIYASGAVTTDGRDWMVLALCQALSKITTSTGHFAQPLSPKASNSSKFCRQRSRSAWREWISAFDNLISYGSASWRRKNAAFNCESLEMIQNTKIGAGPRVIYADPPYTDDQYPIKGEQFRTCLKPPLPEPLRILGPDLGLHALDLGLVALLAVGGEGLGGELQVHQFQAFDLVAEAGGFLELEVGGGGAHAGFVVAQGGFEASPRDGWPFLSSEPPSGTVT